jgi:tetratricopeptide (TPR) repeat protein
MTDLVEAIDVARKAAESTPKDHPNRATWLNGLGEHLESRYERTGEMTDLEEAIDVARKAVESTPQDHPDRAVRLNNLAHKLQSQYERTGETRDLEEASECFRGAWHCRTAIPFHRIRSAARCLRLYATLRKVSLAIQLGKDTIDLLPTVNTRLLNRDDQQFVIKTFAGVATDLCAFLLESNFPDDALLYIENGRAIILGHLVDSRSDVSSLAQHHPEIARRYEELRDEVNTTFHTPKQGEAERQMLKRRREAAAELDQCIEEIRSTLGHERFLLGQTVTQMQEWAADGSIVVINIAESRSDAIIVSATAIRTLNCLTICFGRGVLAKERLPWTKVTAQEE